MGKAGVKNDTVSKWAEVEVDAHKAVDDRECAGVNTVTNEKLGGGSGSKLESNEYAEVLATKILDRTRSVEEKTTDFMKTLENNGGKLTGLEHRIKSQDSLTRKILSDSHIKGISLEEAAEGIGDSLRYTMIISEESYANVATKSLQQLQENGYTINKVKNYWGNDIYQGVNVSLTTPDGVKMELQFHTEDSFYTKEILNHKYYEIARSESATDDEVIEATEKMIENQSHVKVPQNIEKIIIEEFYKNGKD